MNQVTKDEALKMALEALDIAQGLLADARSYHQPKMLAAYTALKQALEAPVQDAKELFGYEIWGCFYRSREELLEAFVDKGIQWVGVKADGAPTGESFNGYNKEWIEANIREVYVHGTPAIAKREEEAKKGQP